MEFLGPACSYGLDLRLLHALKLALSLLCTLCGTQQDARGLKCFALIAPMNSSDYD